MPLLKSVWTGIWKWLAFILIWGIPLAIFIVPFQHKWKQAEQMTLPLTHLSLEFVFAMTILLSAYLMVSFVEKRPFYTLGFEMAHFFRDTLLGVAIGLFWLDLSRFYGLAVGSLSSDPSLSRCPY